MTITAKQMGVYAFCEGCHWLRLYVREGKSKLEPGCDRFKAIKKTRHMQAVGRKTWSYPPPRTEIIGCRNFKIADGYVARITGRRVLDL